MGFAEWVRFSLLKIMPINKKVLNQQFSSGVSLPPPPMGHLAMFGGIWLSELGEEECYWHLMDRNQGKLLTMVQGTRQLPTTKNYLTQNVHSATLRNPVLKKRLFRVCS